jgi:N-acyl-D-aspartate/D-glutamate deacylase
MEGVEDIPNPVLVEGLPWSWESFPDYLDFLSHRQFDIDVGAYMPHAPLRVYTTGGTGCNTPSGACPDLRPFQKIGEETVTDFELGMKADWTAGNVRGRVNLAGFGANTKTPCNFSTSFPLGIPRLAPDFPG